MTNKEFETKCLAVLNGTAEPEVVREVLMDAAYFRADYIDFIGRNDIWDQEHPQVSYDCYVGDESEDAGEYETSTALRAWAKNPTAFLRKES